MSTVSPLAMQADGGSPALPAPLTPEEEERSLRSTEQRAQGFALQALESARDSAVAECWPDGVPSGAGSLVDFIYNIAIDEKGNEVGRGYGATTDGGAPELLDCLRDHAGPPVHLPWAPGHRVNVTVEVTYP